MATNGRHFVLVHGSCHGAWCWYKLVTLLESEGHRVTALDMAASGIHPQRMDQVRSSSDYSEPLIEFMESLTADDDGVILVGHSMGGVNISLAMERFPEKISVAVFVAAFLPGPGFSQSTISEKVKGGVESFLDTELTFKEGQDKPPTSILFGPKFLSSTLYQLSPPKCIVEDGQVLSVTGLVVQNSPTMFEVLITAKLLLSDYTLATLLKRPGPLFNEEIALTREKYGSVRRVYIISDQDALIKEDLQRWMIENNPPHKVKMISGSDHMVMFSKPLELCSCLQDIAENYQ